jgi:hypothetical protein
LETFVKAIELLAEQRSCEVGLIGLGRGDSSFGPHTLASFPTHDPRKGKRIAWAWIKREKRPRRVAIAEVGLENKFAYALEIERTNQEHSILVLAREDSQRIAADRLQAIMLMCALKRGWVPEEQLPGYRRKTTTHRDLVTISVLESRIWRKIVVRLLAHRQLRFKLAPFAMRACLTPEEVHENSLARACSSRAESLARSCSFQRSKLASRTSS